MADRIGPNQDVNDPTTLIEVGYEFNRISENIGTALAISNTQNPEASGSKITDIIIPLQTSSGVVDFDCKDITRDEENEEFFHYDKILWSGGFINTYVNLAEKFRDYWNILNNTIDDLNVFSNTLTEQEGISLDDTGNGFPPWDLYVVSSGYLESASFSLFEPSESFDEPIWSGIGPINYNSGTYPQLLSEVLRLEVDTGLGIWDEIYYWLNGRILNENNLGTANSESMQLEDDFVGINQSASPIKWVQIHNETNSNKTINLQATSTYDRISTTAFQANESVIAESYVIISGISFNPGSSFFWYSVSGVRETEIQSNSETNIAGPFPDSINMSVNHTREIVIPPDLSAFIQMSSICSFGGRMASGTINMSTLVQIEGGHLGVKTRSSTFSNIFNE